MFDETDFARWLLDRYGGNYLYGQIWNHEPYTLQPVLGPCHPITRWSGFCLTLGGTSLFG